MPAAAGTVTGTETATTTGIRTGIGTIGTATLAEMVDVIVKKTGIVITDESQVGLILFQGCIYVMST
jgi:hypothetical protein